jgi:hypothetical protein
MSDYKYTLSLGKMQAMLVRNACITAETEAHKRVSDLRKVPSDLQTPQWSYKVEQEAMKARYYKAISDDLFELIYTKDKEPWQDFVDNLP